MKLFVFGSSLLSCYWNGAATYYRGIYKYLHRLGHEITFAEPDIYQRWEHRDLDEVEYARVIRYRSPEGLGEMLRWARDADAVIKHSGIGDADDWLEGHVPECRGGGGVPRIVYWDVDAPATLARLRAEPECALARRLPDYDLVFTYGGGGAVEREYRRLGARACHNIYNGLDPETHFPVRVGERERADLLFTGHRLPDREERVEDIFLAAARMLPHRNFVLGGLGWGDRELPRNVRWLGHVPSRDHNRLNCSADWVLNINRNSMAHTGYSPPTRIFEAAGAGAAVITDLWPGIADFFSPGNEIMTAANALELVRIVERTSPDDRRALGLAMRQRALREHSYEVRARQADRILSGGSLAARQIMNPKPAPVEAVS